MISLLGKVRIRWQLMFYDVVIYLIVLAFIATTYGLAGSTREEFMLGSVAALAALLICRTLGMVYSMIIRYGGVHVYMRLFATDFFVILLSISMRTEFMTCSRSCDCSTVTN